MRRHFPILIALTLIGASLSLPAQAPERSKRLILKTGDYQTATKWEIKGDRVRYYSAERYTWEELPASLVDWDATDKYEKEHSAAEAIQHRELTKEEEADRAAEEARSPEVAPGLRLPRDGGIFLLDRSQKNPDLQELAQNGGELNRQTGKNILRAAINPIASSVQTIEIPELHSRTQSHAQQPAIYINIDASTDADAADAEGPTRRDPKDALQPTERFRIVRAKLDNKRNVRVVGNLKISMIGKVSQKGDWMGVAAEAMTGGWIKLVPAQALPPGEYAVVEMLSAKTMNLYVWDFGVNPNAPTGETEPAPISSQAPAVPQPTETPTLSGRPK
jgi:hypothetical protein